MTDNLHLSPNLYTLIFLFLHQFSKKGFLQIFFSQRAFLWNIRPIYTPIFHYFILETFLILLSFFIAGINGLVFILLHAIVSITLLELVDYIQHYGLERRKKNGKYDKYEEQHSWNSRHTSANWSTFNLGLHAEHHQTAGKHYPLLSQKKEY